MTEDPWTALVREVYDREEPGTYDRLVEEEGSALDEIAALREREAEAPQEEDE